jgi:spermidine synthase
MNWMFEKFRRLSDKNGEITVEKVAGRWRVLVDGFNETSEGLNEIWRDALLRAKKYSPEDIREVLILGLGGGGMLKDTYEIFPRAHVTVVEHDLEMIAITKELKLYEPHPFPEVLEGDAGQVVPALQTMYDIIVVDLFRGGEPSPLLLDDSFIHAVEARMKNESLLLVNAAGYEEYLELVAQYFTYADKWMFRYNNLGMFKR